MRRNSSDVTRREVLRRFGLAAGFAALGPGCVASRPSGPGAAIKVVVVTDLTGPIGFAGPLNANIAKLVVDDITAGGGLLGRPLNLIVVDSASDPAIGVAKARVRGPTSRTEEPASCAASKVSRGTQVCLSSRRKERPRGTRFQRRANTGSITGNFGQPSVVEWGGRPLPPLHRAIVVSILGIIP